MDKRTLIGINTYQLSNGKVVEVPLYKKTSGTGISIRYSYGVLEAYIGAYCTKKIADDFIKKSIIKHSDKNITIPYMKENVYCYVFGKKRYFTDDVSLKDNPMYFYLPKTTKNPIGRYKKLFLEYVSKRAVELGKLMNRDLSTWKIRTGLFLSYYGICFPTKHQLKFDYRLFAFDQSLIDAVIVHEIAHTYEIHHNQKFYSIVNLYCPNYDDRMKCIETGYFTGEDYQYVI